MTVCATKAAGHAAELAKMAAHDGCRLLLAAGGDGTLGEVANGLVGSETIMAPLPVGTANSFAKELGMPFPKFFQRHRLLQTADALAAGRVHRMDLGYSEDGAGNGRYWLLWAGTGVDGFLVHKIEPRPVWSKKMGPIGYVMQGLIAAPQFPVLRAKVNVDGRLFEDKYVLLLINNCRMYGGEVMLNPEAVLDDGELELWMFKGRGVPRILRHMGTILRNRHFQDADAIMVRGKNITITTEPEMGCHTDGDRAGHTPLTCRVVPGALRLLVPNTADPSMFSQPGEALEE